MGRRESNQTTKQKIFNTYYMCRIKNTEDLLNEYENMKSFFENKKSSDSVLKFLIARQQWIGICGAYIQWPKYCEMNIYIAVSLKHLDEIRHL